MNNLTIIVLGDRKIELNKDVEIIYSNGFNISKDVEKATGRNIVFIKSEDKLSEYYYNEVLDKAEGTHDCCFINYKIEYDYNDFKIHTNENELKEIKPYYGKYIWSFIFNKEKLLKLLQINNRSEFNQEVDKLFTRTTAINRVIYYHNPKGERHVFKTQYTDIKKEEYYKNIIYIGEGANGTFNGYISWIKNIGRCFGNKYDITILYNKITKVTYDAFSKYFNCVQRFDDVNYICDRLLVTYSTYYYPKNIIHLDQNYMFIHGNMSDYKNSRRYYDDLYTHYIGVSKISAKKAQGYFPTNKIEHIINPFKLDEELVKPHLKLTSALRFSQIKRPERIEIIAKILDELDIPYTWNVFADNKENTNMNGVVYRKRTTNPIPYIKDSDYFVLLSDSEAMPYCILESLAVNTKVIVTPLEAYEEIGIKDKENAYIIPFDYFNIENKDKLTKLIKIIYENKDRKVNNKIDENLWDGYNNIFVK